jgi:hypothetical protein
MTIEEILMDLHEIRGFLDAPEYLQNPTNLIPFIMSAWGRIDDLIMLINDDKEMK